MLSRLRIDADGPHSPAPLTARARALAERGTGELVVGESSAAVAVALLGVPADHRDLVVAKIV